MYLTYGRCSASRCDYGAEPSLVRHAVTQLLHLATPPFSAEFARALLRVLQLPATSDAFRVVSVDARQPMLLCVQLLGREHPPLACEVAKLLGQIQGGEVKQHTSSA